MPYARSDEIIDRWFRRVFSVDGTPDGRLTASSPPVLFRMGLIAMLVVAAQYADLDRRALVTTLLVAAIVAQPLIAAIGRPNDVMWQRYLTADLAISTTIALLEPSLAGSHLLLITGLIGAAATCHRPTGFLAFGSVALASAAVVISVGEGGHGPTELAVVAVVGFGFGSWMLRARLVADSARRDHERAVDAAGGIYFTSVVGDPTLHCVGDVQSLLGWTNRRDGRLDLFASVHPDDIDDFWIPDERLHDGAEIDRTARFRTSDGSWKWIRDVSRVTERHGVLHIRGLMLDHTDHLDGLARAETEATTDSLTGLANRRVLMRVLDRDAATRRWVVLLDVDGFKRVNDTLGHDAGDELLRIAAQRIAGHLRSTDLLVRVGGDEFALVLDGDLVESDALGSVDRILAAATEPMDLNGVAVDVSMSAGIAREDPAAPGARVVLGRADLAMYEAKRRPERRARFVEEMEHRHGRKAQLVRDLPTALSNGDLRLFFQPIMRSDGSALVAAEGLARWDHPAFGLLTPADFIDVVLVSSQAVSFTRAMVRDALDMARTTVANRLTVDIAVNIPVSTLEDPAFGRWFFDQCADAGVDPGRLVLETSERDLHSDTRTAEAIRTFTERGVTIAIDDFGTGHSTFERLRWSGVSQLKLDHRIVQGAAVDLRDATILRQVVALASDLGYTVVGEGVETEEQRGMLSDFGVHLAQGFLFAPALDRDDFLAFAEGARAGDPSRWERSLDPGSA